MSGTKRAWRNAMTALALASAVWGRSAAASSIPDATDLWWNEKEPGWGMQVTQNGDRAAATLLVYDESGNPVWYLGVLSWDGLQDYGDTSSWSGDLYRTRGPWLGGSFDPAKVAATRVGEIHFQHATIDVPYEGTVRYRVGTVEVVNKLSRQTFAPEDFGGTFRGVYQTTSRGCRSSADNLTATAQATFTIAQAPGSMTIVASFGDGPDAARCTFSGNFGQAGRKSYLDGPYTCTTGAEGHMLFSSLSRTPDAVSAELYGNAPGGCTVYGRLISVSVPWP